MTASMSEGDAFFRDAPCGLLCASRDRRITAVNDTLAEWLGTTPDELIDRKFTEIFSAGGRIHFETHVAPMLHINGGLAEFALDLVVADGSRRPVLIAANVTVANDGTEVIRIVILDARNRRTYERELLSERRRAEDLQRRAEAERNRAQLFAATLRSSLLPPRLSPPPGVQAAAYYHAATDDVTGDFYDLFPLTPARWGFFLGDVVGKGASAAALTSLTRYTLRAAAVMGDDPRTMLDTLNSVLTQHPTVDESAFATVIVGTVTPSPPGAEIHLATGGHPAPLLFSASGDVREVDTAGGQAVGLIPAPHFAAARFRLDPGDTLLLYSDGLTEARHGPAPHRYDDDGALLQFARRNAPTDADSLVAVLRELLLEIGTGVEDDVALLALGVPAGSALST